MCITGQPGLTDGEPKSSDWDRSVTLQVFHSSPERVWGKAELRPTAEESSFVLLLISGHSTYMKHVIGVLVDQVAYSYKWQQQIDLCA